MALPNRIITMLLSLVIILFVFSFFCEDQACAGIFKYFPRYSRHKQKLNNDDNKLSVIQRIANVYRQVYEKSGLTTSSTNTSYTSNRGKTLRDVNFWSRSLQIYSSYKFAQAKNQIKNRIMFRKHKPISNETWTAIHEKNSERMIKLCLDLRGFYLKTGQFLGTRHDFMPYQYTKKLSKLHDDVPPLNGKEIRKIIEQELNGTIEEYFSSITLEKPIGSASIAQVHDGIWKKTGEKVAVKVQIPLAEKLMVGDLKNLRRLAEFLQKTEFKFDLLSAIVELQKQIANEFDFNLEAKNMDIVRQGLMRSVPQVSIPRSIMSTKKLLVMSFIEGQNLGKMSEFKDKSWYGNSMPKILKERFALKLLDTLAKAWGEQIFTLNQFNADPHPGNICISSSGRVGLLDWGQVKSLKPQVLLNFAKMVKAIHRNNKDEIITAFTNLGIEVTNPADTEIVHKMAVTMLDTKIVPGYTIDPFTSMEMLKNNSVTKMPSDLYFVVRTVQLLRGITFAFGLDYSLADKWAPLAQKVINKN